MKYLTPEKTSFRDNIDTTRLTSDSKVQNRMTETRFTERRIDYKNKTYQLMATVSQLQNRQKSQAQTIFFLQRQLDKINRQIQIFLSSLGVSNLVQAAQKILKPFERNKNKKSDTQVQQQYSKILQQYKIIINKQQQKQVKLETKYKQSSQRYKKYQRQKQQLKNTIQKLTLQLKQSKNFQIKLQQSQTQIGLKQKRIQQVNQNVKKLQQLNQEKQKKIQIREEQKKNITQELRRLKVQFKNILKQKQTVEDKYQNLKVRYKQQINHFQQIQNEVEVKLIQVQKEMNAYREEKEGHIYQIKMLKQQLRVREEQREFSFGGLQHAQTQTQECQQEYLPSFNMECYETSIKSLLQENDRLKKALISLAHRQEGQQLSQEASLQLKLLIGVKQFQKQMNKIKTRKLQKEEAQIQQNLQENQQILKRNQCETGSTKKQ